MSLIIKDSEGFPVFYKDVTAVLDYMLDLTGWFVPNPADSLKVADCSVVTQGEIVVDSWSVNVPNNSITAFVSGGITGSVHRVDYNFGTEGNRKDKRTFSFSIVDR